jgi:hypothetical protein
MSFILSGLNLYFGFTLSTDRRVEDFIWFVTLGRRLFRFETRSILLIQSSPIGMGRKFCNLPAGLFHAFECATCCSMYAAVMTRQHSGASFNESVVWLMCDLEVIAGYTCTNALRCTAKIHAVE